MKAKTLQIVWHDKMPIYSMSFSPLFTTTTTTTVPTPTPPTATAAAAEAENNAPQSGKEGGGGGEEEASTTVTVCKLATAGADGNIRIWSVTTAHDTHTTGAQSTSGASPVQYLATLSRHTGGVNTVRWSPNGELLASCGDDGSLILWKQATEKQPAVFGDAEEDQDSVETWRIHQVLRGGSAEMFDMAWSPDGDMIIVGCLDNTAKVYDLKENRCVLVLSDHSHFVQGVAWDPLKEYIVTQSSDRYMNIYSYTRDEQPNKPLSFKTKTVAKVHRRTVANPNYIPPPPAAPTPLHAPSSSSSSSSSSADTSPHPPSFSANTPSTLGANPPQRSVPGTPLPASSVKSSKKAKGLGTEAKGRKSVATLESFFKVEARKKEEEGDVEMGEAVGLDAAEAVVKVEEEEEKKDVVEAAEMEGVETEKVVGGDQEMNVDDPNATLLPCTPAPKQRSLTDTSSPTNTTTSPFKPVPVTPFPATTTATSNPSPTTSYKMFHDENLNSFFRRLQWSPDGSLLVVPAGLYKDPKDLAKTQPSSATEEKMKNTCYVFARGRLTGEPILHFPGHKKPPVAIAFNPNPYINTPTLTPTLATAQPSLKLPYKFYLALLTTDSSIVIYSTAQPYPVAVLQNLHYGTLTDCSWSADGRVLVVSSTDGFASLVSFGAGELGEVYRGVPLAVAEEGKVGGMVGVVVDEGVGRVVVGHEGGGGREEGERKGDGFVGGEQCVGAAATTTTMEAARTTLSQPKKRRITPTLISSVPGQPFKPSNGF
ncbi:hypothetical protein HDV05_006154 [Chytridiales sp. JEL 0842]|nr:hypothetical protein HDV05_006154 [Chytridiales sp. JEL 0842]